MNTRFDAHDSDHFQDCTRQIAVLAEAAIECDDLHPHCVSKRCQPSITPNIGRKCCQLSVCPPLPIDLPKLMHKSDPTITENRIVQLPRVKQRHGVLLHHGGIGCQSQKCLLGQTAKADAVIRVGIKPRFCNAMASMNIECQRQPEINVSQIFHRCPNIPRSFRWSSEVAREYRSAPAETERETMWVRTQPSRAQLIRQCASLPEGISPRQFRSRRCEQHPSFSCIEYPTFVGTNQARCEAGGCT